MIFKNYLTIFFVFVGFISTSQNKVCTSAAAGDVTDINTIGKCAIENFKKSKKTEYIKVSTRKRYVRRRTPSLKGVKKNINAIARINRFTASNVEVLPMFNDCVSASSDQQLKCFNDQIDKHVSDNLQYPEEALKKGIEDKVLATFTINTTGEVINIKTESATKNQLLEDEAKRIVKALPKFTPAKHKGIVTDIKHKVFVNFNLSFDNKKVNEGFPISSSDEGLIKEHVRFDMVNEEPVFIGCADYGAEEQKECIKETIVNNIVDNLIYPFDAASEGIEGRVWVRFIVDTDGYVKNITTTGGTNTELLEKEAERLIKLLPKFLPGKHNNDYVNVEYFIPIDFQLDE
ncbi:energy transducer TonB [Tenacibaculum sp. M341]|uniref:energy transducer TonB n=1 Tax=Tenacibaculum sp. M341 TaxID=2530339 RepID=UPI001049E3A6|nr:energy transducer TonB [Tenacibaculum sp. M341]TCI93576.1 energy transducer TonB [Tenacibaculum sp. M341]